MANVELPETEMLAKFKKHILNDCILAAMEKPSESDMLTFMLNHLEASVSKVWGRTI